MNTETVKVSELSGAALDWAVAKAEGWGDYEDDGDYCTFNCKDGRTDFLNLKYFSPSSDWSQGGPITERESIQLTPCEDMISWSAGLMFHQGCEDYEGPTPLIAAMRCYVASKMGDSVDIPEELC